MRQVCLEAQRSSFRCAGMPQILKAGAQHPDASPPSFLLLLPQHEEAGRLKH